MLLLLHLATEELRSEATSIRLLHLLLLLLLLLHHLQLLHLLHLLLFSHLVLLRVEASHGIECMVFVISWCSVRVCLVHIHHCSILVICVLLLTLDLTLPSELVLHLLLTCLLGVTEVHNANRLFGGLHPILNTYGLVET